MKRKRGERKWKLLRVEEGFPFSEKAENFITFLFHHLLFTILSRFSPLVIANEHEGKGRKDKFHNDGEHAS